jgi:hypothetical protein
MIAHLLHDNIASITERFNNVFVAENPKILIGNIEYSVSVRPCMQQNPLADMLYPLLFAATRPVLHAFAF